MISDSVFRGQRSLKKTIESLQFQENQKVIKKILNSRSICSDLIKVIDNEKTLEKFNLELVFKNIFVLKKISKKNNLITLSALDKASGREVDHSLFVHTCLEGEKDSSSQKIDNLCDLLSGTMYENQCLFSNSTQEIDRNKIFCKGRVVDQVRTIDTCSKEIVYRCEKKTACNEGESAICRLLFKGKNLILYEGEIKKKLLGNATCGTQASQNRNQNCTERSTGETYTCPWDKECSINQKGEKCTIPKYFLCKDSSQKVWYCPSGISERREISATSIDPNVSEVDFGSIDTELSFVFGNKNRKADFYIYAKSFNNGGVVNQQSIEKVKNAVCGKRIGICH